MWDEVYTIHNNSIIKCWVVDINYYSAGGLTVVKTKIGLSITKKDTVDFTRELSEVFLTKKDIIK